MYRIIGADGREYGPISADQLRQWIAESRANAATRVLSEGATEWRALGTLPEFSLLFVSAAPARSASGPAVWTSAPLPKTHGLATTGFILGLLSFFCCCLYGAPFNILALVFSIIAMVQIRSEPERYTGQGLAIAGLVLSILNILMYLALLVLGISMNNWEEVTHHAHRL